jgi:alpha 1,3-glucosidase
MKHDPFTLRVALSKTGSARGELYLDDGETFSHRDGKIVWREFLAETKGRALRISSGDLALQRPDAAVDGVVLRGFDPSNEFAKSIQDVKVEKVVVVALDGKPTSVKTESGNDLAWEYTPGVSASDRKEGVASVLTIKNPGVAIAKDWAIVVQM